MVKLEINHRFLFRAMKEAEASEYKMRMGAVIFKGRKVASVGRNFANKCNHIPNLYKRWPTSIHAEMDALINTKSDISGYSILVIRINSSNQLMLAKPCMHCEAYLRFKGIRHVFFSTREGLIDSYSF